MEREQPFGTCLVIQNGAKRYLMQFRDGNPKNDPLTWDFFGGMGDEHETGDEEGVKKSGAREMGEELEIEVQPDDLVLIAEETIDGVRNVLLRYQRTVEQTDITLREGAGFGYFTKDELLRLDLIQRVRVLVEKYFE